MVAALRARAQTATKAMLQGCSAPSATCSAGDRPHPVHMKTQGPSQGGDTEPLPSNREKDPDDWVTGDERMTGAQASYLKTLSEEARVPFDPTLSKADASKRIDELQKVTGRGVPADEADAADAADSADPDDDDHSDDASDEQRGGPADADRT